MDIGNFSKHVLLTGAGWSRNWGARLADGVWQLLMDDPDVAANDRLLVVGRYSRGRRWPAARFAQQQQQG